MIKNKKYNSYTVAIGLLGLAVVYLLDVMNIFPKPNYQYQEGIGKVLFVFVLGLVVSLILLLFFKANIFMAWVKHIAWWYLPIATWFVFAPENDLFYGHTDFAIMSMTILFIITLAYALVAAFIQRKKQGSAPE